MDVFAECGNIIKTGALPLSLFTGGLLGGLTHCAGMCGPFVIAQAGVMQRLSLVSLLPYHIGRMTTYVALAVLTNTVLNLAFPVSALRSFISAPLLAIAGVAFIVSAFPAFADVLPWATRFRIGLPQAWLARLTSPFTYQPGIFKGYMLGVLLGLMPCGLVFSALLASSTATNAFHAALAMAAFSLGTMPALLAVAIGGRRIGALFPRASKNFFRLVAAFNGIWLIIFSALLLGIRT